jgi:pyruvate/2-oxoglutarate dehydrogenase complex dihydrolipoamide acyltransferase (E2) component
MASIQMPEMGSGIAEGTIVKWFKSKGERVVKGESLVEIMVEKVTTELPSPIDGILVEIFYPENATAAVGAHLASIAEG